MRCVFSSCFNFVCLRVLTCYATLWILNTESASPFSMKSFSVFRMSEACRYVGTWPIETQIACLGKFSSVWGLSMEIHQIQANTFGLKQWLGLIVNLNCVGYGIHRDYMRLQYLNPDKSVEIHQLYVYTGEGIAGQIQMRLYFCHAHWTQHWN